MMLIRAQLCARSFGFLGFTPSSTSDHHQSSVHSHSPIFPNSRLCQLRIFPNSRLCQLRILSLSNPKKCRNFALIRCQNHSREQFHPHSHHSDDEFLEASILISETVKHHHLRKQGFQEEVVGRKFSRQSVSFSTQVKDRRNDVNSIGFSILRRFQQPTIFLKISCEGDFLLPVVVGEVAVEKLIDSLNDEDHGECSNSFQFVRDLVVGLENEVRMVKITERAVNTYFASVYFGKVGERENFRVDAQPSDAINVAQRCKAPIYVNKHIVLADAIKISYGTGRILDTKSIYDVLLDSPMDGPDLLVVELNLVRNMKLAAKEERYNDAAMWRDKLEQLRESGLQTSQAKIWHQTTPIPDLP